MLYFATERKYNFSKFNCMENSKPLSKKEKIFSVLSKPYIVVLVMLFAPLLNYWDRNFSYFFALGIVLLILWSSGFNWSLFGFGKKITPKTVLWAFLLTLGLIVVDTCFSLLVVHFFGEPDLSALEGIRDNTTQYLVLLAIVWVFAAFGEELIFRGYYMKWLAELFGNSNNAWLFSGVIISIYFGLSHYYQGPSGMIGITFLALIIAFIFYRNRNNLGLLVLIHGFHDTYGLTLLYLDKENPVMDFAQQIFSLS